MAVVILVAAQLGVSGRAGADAAGDDTPLPEVQQLSIVEGPSAGGTQVEINGGVFGPFTRVLFGGVAAACFSVRSESRIVASTPAHAPGPVDVTVEHALYGPSPPHPDALFTYVASPPPPLSVAGLRSVAAGPSGGTSVVVMGQGFCRDTNLSVAFAGEPSPSVEVRSDTDLIAAVPPGVSGEVSVTVSAGGAQSQPGPGTTVAIDAATYVPPSTTTTLSRPPAGPPEQRWAECAAAAAGPSCPAPMNTARFLQATVVLDPPACQGDDPLAGYPCGQVLVVGGEQGFCEVGCTPINSAEVYDPSTGTWRRTAPMAWPRGDLTATLLDDGRVLSAGGSNGGPLSNAEIYDPVAETWMPAANLRTARFAHSATLLGGPACAGRGRPGWCGKVLVAGGTLIEISRAPIQDAELYDPVTDAWTVAGYMTTARANHTATMLPTGQLLLAGGLGNDEGIRTAELYDPPSDSWRPTTDMAIPRVAHTATLVGDGGVLVVGGVEGSHPPRYLASASVTTRPQGCGARRASLVPVGQPTPPAS